MRWWRKRLAKSERPHRINEGSDPAWPRKRAVDSTMLADAVATLARAFAAVDPGEWDEAA
jgi:hypothetical protein